MQVVGYDTGQSDPAVLVASGGDLSRESLESGRELTYSLGTRRCAGTLDGERHLPCDRERAPYCDQHTSRWPCARCRGDCTKPVEACDEEHAVYLAAFAPATFKVGVTRSWRLEQRLREQGADRAAHVRTVADGRIARQIEADIAVDVGDQVRVRKKVDGLHQSVLEEAWEDRLADFSPLATYDFAYGLDLADRPVAETLLAGTVRGVQGRVLVLETEAGTYAVDLRDLVGYELQDGAPGRNLQSSLGAFQ